MKSVINSEKLPIKLWLDEIEEGALQQARNLANHRFAKYWVAIMPDSHVGYGMPIGGVLCTDEVVIPNAVGVDIGCGMCVVKAKNMQHVDTDTIKKIMGAIRRSIPVGFDWHKQSQMDMNTIQEDHTDVITPHLNKASKQVGTLGGGNHFIELQENSEGNVHIMIHSGSRNIGKQVADYYDKKARELNARWGNTVPLEWELAYLPLDHELAQDYITDMNYCIAFALENRMLMMKRAMEAVEQTVGGVEWGDIWNEPHNFARFETQNNKNVLVHRKGATSARKGELGMIPGSQGTASYLVRGRGNEDSFESCSHGSGRTMGRNQARKNLDVTMEKRMLDEQGIVHSIRSVKDLDEAPSAYKNIEEVMSNQQDLIEIVDKLKPRGVIKG